MDAKTLAVVQNVHFIQSDDSIVAEPFDIDLCHGYFGEPEVLRAATELNLPTDRWVQSEYGLHWVRKT